MKGLRDEGVNWSRNQLVNGSRGLDMEAPDISSDLSPPPPPPPPKDPVDYIGEMPRFPGCENQGLSGQELTDCAKNKMLTYIYSNIRYPSEARKKSVEGMVVIQYIVEKDGAISNAELLRDIGAGCGEESLRVVNTMNDMDEKWIPGQVDGEIARVAYTLPVKFRLR